MTAITASKPTQMDIIRAHLEAGKSITPLHALTVYGISRLSAVIERLRIRGLPIVTLLKQDEMGRKYSEYRLAGELKVGSKVTVKAGHGWGLPKWVKRSVPAPVTGLLNDTAYVTFTHGKRQVTLPLNVKELNHVA